MEKRAAHDNPEVHDYHDNPSLQSEHQHHHNTSHFSDVRTYLSWSAPGRPFRKKSREYYYTSLLLMGLLEVILFLFSQYALMLVVGSLVFLAFVLASVPPQNYHYRVSSEGIKVEDHFYIWPELYDFYFKRFDGIDTLIIRTQDLIPGELQITLGDLTREHVRKILVQFLPYREIIKPTFMERSAEWLARSFPLERKHHAS